MIIIESKITFKISDSVKAYCKENVLSATEAFENLQKSDLSEQVQKAIEKMYKKAIFIEFEVLYLIDSHGESKLFTYRYPAGDKDRPIFAIKGESAKTAYMLLSQVRIPTRKWQSSTHFYITIQYVNQLIFSMVACEKHKSEIVNATSVNPKNVALVFELLTGKNIDEYIKLYL